MTSRSRTEAAHLVARCCLASDRSRSLSAAVRCASSESCETDDGPGPSAAPSAERPTPRVRPRASDSGRRQPRRTFSKHSARAALRCKVRESTRRRRAGAASEGGEPNVRWARGGSRALERATWQPLDAARGARHGRARQRCRLEPARATCERATAQSVSEPDPSSSSAVVSRSRALPPSPSAADPPRPLADELGRLNACTAERFLGLVRTRVGLRLLRRRMVGLPSGGRTTAAGKQGGSADQRGRG